MNQYRILFRSVSVLMLAVCVLFLACFSSCKKATSAEKVKDISTKKIVSGAWGDLEISYIQISPPIEFVPELRVFYDTSSWDFPGWDKETTKRFIESSPLPKESQHDLISRMTGNLKHKGVTITPTEEDILGLTADSRSYIYNHLAGFKVNRSYDMVHRYAYVRYAAILCIE